MPCFHYRCLHCDICFVWLWSFIPQTKGRTGGGWFKNSAGEVNVGAPYEWRLVMDRSEIVIGIEMFKFCILGWTMTMVAVTFARGNCEWLFRSCHSRGVEEVSRTRHALYTCFFLGAFIKLRKALSCPSFRPSGWSCFAPTGRIWMKFYIWIFLKICRETLGFIVIWRA